MNVVQTPLSDDVVHLDQLIARVSPEDQEKIGPAFDALKGMRSFFYRNDCQSNGRHLGREIWLRMCRTIILEFGHAVDNVKIAHLLCHKNMLVLDCDGVPGHFRSPTAFLAFFNPPDRSIYSGLDEATITCNKEEFKEKLKSNSFTSLMVFGSNTLSSGIEDPKEFIELIYQHVTGDLPRIFIIG